MTKTMNEQMEELEAEIKEGNEDYYSTKEVDILEARKSQLQTDMKVMEEFIKSIYNLIAEKRWDYYVPEITSNIIKFLKEKEKELLK